MLKTYSVLIFSLIGFSAFSQTITTQKEQILVNENKLPLEKTQAEQNLSYEEQGFKAIEVGEKIVYRKEVNGIILEFRPKEK